MRLSHLILAFLVPALSSADEEAKAWLDKMNRAVQNLTGILPISINIFRLAPDRTRYQNRKHVRLPILHMRIPISRLFLRLGQMTTFSIPGKRPKVRHRENLPVEAVAR